MRTFAIFNAKGGVGKTTTAINLAYILAAEYGRRVLLVDADGQANATQLLLPRADYVGLAGLLGGGIPCYDEVVEKTDIPNLDMLPASDSMWKVVLGCISSEGRDTFRGIVDLRVALEEDDAYDVMVIDCPPHFSVASVSAIRASDCIVIPVLADMYSAEGMANVAAQINGISELAPQVHIGGVLINQYHNAAVVLDAVEYIRESSPVPVYSTVIRRTDKVMESTWACQPVLMWSPYSSAARDYRAWVKELMAKEEMRNGV